MSRTVATSKVAELRQAAVLPAAARRSPALVTSVTPAALVLKTVPLVTVLLSAMATVRWVVPEAVTTAATVPGRNSGDRAGCRTARRRRRPGW
jgi:hypothetical protein